MVSNLDITGFCVQNQSADQLMSYAETDRSGSSVALASLTACVALGLRHVKGTDITDKGVRTRERPLTHSLQYPFEDKGGQLWKG